MSEKLFSDLPQSDIEKLHAAGHLRPMQQGETIFYKNEPGTEFFIILTGKVAVVDELDEDKLHGNTQAVLAELGVGECFGEMAVFTGRKRSATVTCVEPGQLLAIDEEKLRTMAETDLPPQFLMQVLVVLSGRLRRINAQYMAAKYAGKPKKQRKAS